MAQDSGVPTLGAVGLKWATVVGEQPGWPGVQVLDIRPDDLPGTETALLYLDLMPPVAVGERVLVNTTAEQLELGSGGYQLVVSHAHAPQQLSGEGHLIKLRYTPWQLKVFGPEEPGHPDHDRLSAATSLDGLPVAAAELYSQIAPLAAAFTQEAPGRRLVFVMNDSASLPYAFGRLAGELRRAGLLAATISAGQAFGAEVEAITVHSALLIARHLLAADAVVVSGGPGLLGSATPFGHTGMAQGEALNAAVALDGRPLCVLRMSGADRRERHLGLSHHTRTVLDRLVLRPVTVALPQSCPPKLAQEVAEVLGDRHQVQPVEVDGRWHQRLDAASIALRSMGRSYDDDRLFFDAAAAAGSQLARWVSEGA